MREEGDSGRKKAGWAAVGGVVLLLGKLVASKALRKVLPAGSWGFWLLVAGAVALAAVGGVWLVRRIRRRRAEGSRRARHALGEPYEVRVIDGAPATGLLAAAGIAPRTCASLELTDRTLALDLSAFGSRNRISVPYAEIDEVAFRPDRIVVRHRGTALRGRIEIVGLDWAPRQDLEWEFAVRCPDAVERGNLRTPRPPTGGDLDGPGPPATQRAPRDAAEALSRLDEAMARLGSEMAPPAVRPNPAPPRSGLGCGLFPPQPDRQDDAPA